MTRERSFRAFAFVLGLLAAPGVLGRADAQELEPVEPSGVEPTPAAEVEGPLAGLAMTASLGGGWNSNASFQPAGQPSASAFGEGGLTRTWRIPNWTLSADVGAGGSVYRTGVDTNRYHYGGGLSASGRVGTLTDLSFTGNGGVEYTDFQADPSTDGLVLPLTLSQRLNGGFGLGRQLGAQTRLDLTAGYGRYFFDSEELVDAEAISAGASLSRSSSSRSSFSLAYGFQSNQYGQGTHSITNTVFGGFTRRLSDRWTLAASLGTDGRSFEGSDVRWTLNANGTLGYEAGLTNWSLRYRRAVSPGPGLGTDRILNLFSLIVVSTPRPWLTFNVTGSHGINQDPVDQGLSYATDVLAVSLRFRLTRTLGLAPLLQVRRRAEVNERPAVSDFRVGVALDYVGFHR